MPGARARPKGRAPTQGQLYDDEHPFAQVREPVSWDNLQRFLPHSGGRILDVGGGSGRLVVRLARLGYHVTLSNIIAGELPTVRDRLEAKGLLERVIIQRMDVKKLKYLPDEHFDLALSQGEIISRCPDPARAIAEMVRVTRPGGYVVGSAGSRAVAVQAMARGNWDAAERMLDSGAASEYRYLSFVRLFTVAEMQALFEQAGLRVVRTVGKAVFFERMPPEAQRRVLTDPKALSRLIELEIKHAADPAWAGSACCFEMVGQKEKDESVKLLHKVWG